MQYVFLKTYTHGTNVHDKIKRMNNSLLFVQVILFFSGQLRNSWLEEKPVLGRSNWKFRLNCTLFCWKNMRQLWLLTRNLCSSLKRNPVKWCPFYQLLWLEETSDYQITAPGGFEGGGVSTPPKATRTLLSTHTFCREQPKTGPLVMACLVALQ